MLKRLLQCFGDLQPYKLSARMTHNILETNLSILENIFGKAYVPNKIERLKEIFRSTEKSWLKNPDRPLHDN